MAIQNLRSSSAHKRPIPNVLSAGQIAVNINQASPGLFFKDSNGDLVKVGPVHIGTSAPNSSPATTAADALVSGTVYQILTLGTTDFTAVGASANTVGVVFTATGAGTGTGTVSGQQGNQKGEQWLDNAGGTYVLKIWDGTAWRSESGTFVDVSGDTMTGALGVVAGTASAPGVFFSGDTNTGLLAPAADSVAITTGGTQRIVVDSSGRVGIGTTSASESLEVAGNGLKVSGQTSSVTDEGITFDWDSGSNNGRIFSESAGSSNLLFYTTSSGTRAEAMRIDSSGRVLIGTDASGFADAAHNLTIADDGNCGMTIRAGTSSSVSSIYFADGTTGGANYAGFIDYQHNGDHMRFGTNGGQERMRIDSTGRIGIGVSTMAGGAGDLTIIRNSALRWADSDGTQRADIYGDSSSNIVFRNGTGSTERMRITSAGNVGIGTTSPNAKLHCTGDIKFGDAITLSRSISTGLVTFTDATAEPFSQGFAFRNNETAEAYRFQNGDGTSTYLTIRGSGNVGIGDTAPSTKFSIKKPIDSSAYGAGTRMIDFKSYFPGYDETGIKASIFSGVDSASPLSTNKGYLAFLINNGSSDTSLDERMRIDSAGNIGIGTTSPTQKLDVRGSVYVGDSIGIDNSSPSSYASDGRDLVVGSGSGSHGITIATGASNSGTIYFADGTSGASLYTGTITYNHSSNYMAFWANESERMRITNQGATWAAANTSVNAFGSSVHYHGWRQGSGNQWVGSFVNEGSSAGYGVIVQHQNTTQDTSHWFFNCNNNNGNKAIIYTNGGLANFQSNNANLCDEREKKNIETLDSTWGCLKNWELKKFHYNEDADTDDKRYGVIAQQIAEYCPEVITDWTKRNAEDAVLDEDGNVVTPAVEEIIRMGVKEQQMMWMAIKALQEAQARIETLEQRLSDAGIA